MNFYRAEFRDTVYGVNGSATGIYSQYVICCLHTGPNHDFEIFACYHKKIHGSSLALKNWQLI